jgi:hypothetical protein
MKRIYSIILIFNTLITFSFAQPQGKLFLQTGFVNNNVLQYIQYPDEQFFFIDSTEIDGMIWADNKLIVSNNNIYSYEYPNFNKSIYINTNNALLLSKTDDYLGVSKAYPPYFEVYSFQNKNLIFSIDTNKISTPINDLLLSSDRAYLLLDNKIAIVSLNTKDTLAIISTDIHPFSFSSYNQYIVEKGDKIFIEVEIATGVPRFCLLSLDKNTLQLNLLFFKEGIDTPFQPILADNIVYMSTFPSHYDILADSFYYYSNPSYQYALEYDKSSNSVFVYSPINQTINYFCQNSFSNSLILPSVINYSLFVDESPVSIDNPELIKSDISIFPNPTNKYLNIKSLNQSSFNKISIIDIKGQKIDYNIQNNLGEYKIDIENFAEGVYIIEIVSDKKISRFKFLKK